METVKFVLWNVFLVFASAALFVVLYHLIRRHVSKKSMQVVCEAVLGLLWGTFTVYIVFPHMW